MNFVIILKKCDEREREFDRLGIGESFFSNLGCFCKKKKKI